MICREDEHPDYYEDELTDEEEEMKLRMDIERMEYRAQALDDFADMLQGGRP